MCQNKKQKQKSMTSNVAKSCKINHQAHLQFFFWSNFLMQFIYYPSGSTICNGVKAHLKVSKSRKKNMVSSILPNNERWDNFMYWKLSQRSFFGRIEDTIICFWDFLTFRRSQLIVHLKPNLKTFRYLSMHTFRY